MTATVDAHRGDLEEADYGFVCWTVCACGWRSRGYPKSSAAWTAHEYHRAACVDD